MLPALLHGLYLSLLLLFCLISRGLALALLEVEFCNVTRIEVDSGGFLKGIIFSPGFPAKYGNVSVGRSCTITVGGLKRAASTAGGKSAIVIKIKQHTTGRAACMQDLEHNPSYQTSIDLRITGHIASHSCPTIEKYICDMSEVQLTLDVGRYIYDKFYITVEIYPAFFSKQYISLDKHTHGYIGAGDNYAQSFINRPLSQQPSGYHTSPSHRDSSSKPSHFDYYTSLTSYRTTNFVKIEFIRFKIGNVTDCSTATVTEGLLLADIFNSTFYFIAEKINIEVHMIKEDTNVFISCPIFEVYHQHGTSMMIQLRYALVGEGYTLKYMSESCDEDIENLKFIEALPSRNNRLYRVACEDGYRLRQESSATYQCLAGQWIPKKPECVPKNPKDVTRFGTNESIITEEPLAVTGGSDMSVPLMVSVGVTGILLLTTISISVTYITLLKRRISSLESEIHDGMTVDVIIPTEIRHIYSLPSSTSGLSHHSRLASAGPVESGAFIDPEIPSPPLTPRPTRREGKVLKRCRGGIIDNIQLASRRSSSMPKNKGRPISNLYPCIGTDIVQRNGRKAGKSLTLPTRPADFFVPRVDNQHKYRTIEPPNRAQLGSCVKVPTKLISDSGEDNPMFRDVHGLPSDHL